MPIVRMLRMGANPSRMQLLASYMDSWVATLTLKKPHLAMQKRNCGGPPLNHFAMPNYLKPIDLFSSLSTKQQIVYQKPLKRHITPSNPLIRKTTMIQQRILKSYKQLEQMSKLQLLYRRTLI